MRNLPVVLLLLPAALLSLPPRPLPGQDNSTTHEVKPGKFEVQTELSGVFAAEKTVEMSVEPNAWSQFKVVEAVPHGAKVTEGQLLVRFDDEEINDAIEDMETDQQLAELSIMQAEEELPRLRRALDLQYETAQRARRLAEEDLERWNEIDRALSVKSAEQRLKSTKNNLEYQQEELDQLQQMYEADDLTEETEEIILKRQRNAVESAEFAYELARVRQEEVTEVLVPRLDAAMKSALKRAELDLAQAKTALAYSANEKQFSLEKAKHSRKRALERHADLLADRELMTVEAPIDGIVYYGRAVDGKWSGTKSMIESLKPGGTVSAKSVFMTIVQPRPLQVLSTVAEKDVVEIQPGATAIVVPTADEDTQITAKVADKSAVPMGDGTFPLEVELTGDVPGWAVPGMTCKVKVTTYEKEEALTVPEGAVRTDEDDEEKKYVLVHVEGEDEPERRDVEVGKTHDGRTEILKGLKAGEKVLLGDAKAVKENGEHVAEEAKKKDQPDEAEPDEEPRRDAEKGDNEKEDETSEGLDSEEEAGTSTETSTEEVN